MCPVQPPCNEFGKDGKVFTLSNFILLALLTSIVFVFYRYGILVLAYFLALTLFIGGYFFKEKIRSLDQW